MVIMDTTQILAYLVLAGLAANGIDFSLTRRPGFIHFPGSGILRALNAVWVILNVVFAWLCLLRVISVAWFIIVGASYCIFAQAYSIYHRHRMKVPA